jgi:hypothetical protein
MNVLDRLRVQQGDFVTLSKEDADAIRQLTLVFQPCETKGPEDAESGCCAPCRARAEAEAEFTGYFVRNYPGPNTIIGNPHWHAPKIFRAATHALRR